MNTTLWILNTVGLLATTVGVLIVFLHLHRTSRAVDTALLPAVCQPFLKDRKMLTVTVGLMAAWFVVQYVAVLFT
jgi:hypothetical protein